jgi:hypothetical protein
MATVIRDLLVRVEDVEQTKSNILAQWKDKYDIVFSEGRRVINREGEVKLIHLFAYFRNEKGEFSDVDKLPGEPVKVYGGY